MIHEDMVDLSDRLLIISYWFEF